MRKYHNLHARIRALRAGGKTFGEIQGILGVVIPKSTLSHLCRGVILPPDYRSKVLQKIQITIKGAQQKAVEVNRRKRSLLLNNIRDSSRNVVRRTNREGLRVALAMLYLGEGSKWKSHRGLMLGSSYPVAIRLYIQLLEICYGIRRSQLRARISFRADQNLRALQNFWSKEPGFHQSIFTELRRIRGRRGGPRKGWIIEVFASSVAPGLTFN